MTNLSGTPHDQRNKKKLKSRGDMNPEPLKEIRIKHNYKLASSCAELASPGQPRRRSSTASRGNRRACADLEHNETKKIY